MASALSGGGLALLCTIADGAGADAISSSARRAMADLTWLSCLRRYAKGKALVAADADLVCGASANDSHSPLLPTDAWGDYAALDYPLFRQARFRWDCQDLAEGSSDGAGAGGGVAWHFLYHWRI